MVPPPNRPAGESLQVQRAEKGKLCGVSIGHGVVTWPALDREESEGAVPYPDPPGQAG